MEYDKQTLKEMKKGMEILRKAYVYAQRIDWLLSGDDGERTFHERLKEDLEELKRKKEAMISERALHSEDGTELMLERFAGCWHGDETAEEIMMCINENKSIRGPLSF